MKAIVTAAAIAGLLTSGCGPVPVLTATGQRNISTVATTAVEGTAGQQQAVKKATSYLRSQSFSRAGLLDQLDYEGFSASDAEYAVAYLESKGQVDWMKQAVEKGKSYLEGQSFSLSSLIDQLEYEKFTPAQAQHGATTAYGS